MANTSRENITVNEKTRKKTTMSTKKPKKKCFVLMPFRVKEMDKPRYPNPNHWDDVYQGLIQCAVKGARLICERDDEDIGTRLIIVNILKKIEEADLILCDLSSFNPNVFLELGWALRCDKPYILIKDDLTTYTFDLNQVYIFNYSHSLQPSGLEKERKALTHMIKNTLADPERRYSLLKPQEPSIPPSPPRAKKGKEESPEKSNTARKTGDIKDTSQYRYLVANYGLNDDTIKHALIESQSPHEFVEKISKDTGMAIDAKQRLRTYIYYDENLKNWFEEYCQKVRQESLDPDSGQ